MPLEKLNETFPGALKEDEFVATSSALLSNLGFTSDNTLACIGTCREEMTRSLELKLMQKWGLSFNLSALGGVLTLGKSGFGIATNRAPNTSDRKRFAFFIFTHIGMAQDGTLGVCQQTGNSQPCKSCEALVTYQEELQKGLVDYQVYANNTEMGLMKRRLRKQLNEGEIPDLMTITRAAHDASLADLEKLIENSLETDTTDWAVFSGVQIHLPDAQYVWPGVAYCVTNSQKNDLQITS